jgi:signal transduction histidine kinase
MLKFGKIGRRLLAWFLIIALIPLLFMGFQGYNSARRAIEQEAYLHMQAVAATKVSQIGMWFEERRNDVQLLTANPHLREAVARLGRQYDSETVELILNELESYRSSSQSYDYLCLYDDSGEPYCCTQVGGEFIADFHDSEIFERVKTADSPVFSPIHLHERIGPVVQIGARYTDENNNTLGILVATLSLAGTLNPIILDSTGLGKTGEAYLIDADRWMLTPSRFMNHPAPLTHQMDSEGIQLALQGSSGVGVYEGWYGEPVLGAWIYVPEQRWALLAEISAKEAFEPLENFRRSTIIVALLTLGAILIVVLFVSRSISEPIRQLAEASRAVSEGDLDQSVSVRLKDELGDLAERFNSMVQSLKSSRQAERDSYESLVRAREDLLRAEKLAAVGELAASIVHEVRNPLSSVKMNLQILETRHGSDETTAEHIRLAMTQTGRLEKLLNELLDFSKPVHLEREPVSLLELVEEVAHTFRDSGESTSGKLQPIQIDPALRVDADRDKFHQVLLNLLLNAVQAMDEGQIEITAERVEIDHRRYIKLTVRDNGRGIPADKLDKVFEPFFTTRKDGTGLGLPNARKIVQAHGGDITIHSTAGQGTTVELTIQEAA